MTADNVFVPMFNAKQLNKFENRLMVLKNLQKNPRAAHPQICKIISKMIEGFEELMLNKVRRTAENILKHEHNMQTLGKLENHVITYVLVKGESIAKVEDLSLQWIS